MSDPIPRYPGTPRWVKWSLAVMVVLALVAAFVMAAGVGGDHGPWRHTAPPSAGETSP